MISFSNIFWALRSFVFDIFPKSFGLNPLMNRESLFAAFSCSWRSFFSVADENGVF